MFRIGWFLLLFAVSGWAQRPGDPIARARLEGAVVSSAGGPVGRTTVRLQGPPNAQAQPRSYAVTADDSGRFVFANVEPGRNYYLTTERPGFLQGRYGARSPDGPGVPFALESGQTITGVTITMVPQSAISGRVTDTNGDPIPGATVTMLRRGYVRGFRQLTEVGAHNTNDLGEYRVANLSPGRYYMAVTNRSGGGQGAGMSSPVTTYYPNGTDAQSAAPLDIIAGQDMRAVDIQMRSGRVYSVHGKAIDASGSALGNIGLLWTPQIDIAASTILNPMTRVQVQTARDGTFAIGGVSPGLYTLQTSPTQAGGPRGLGRVEVTVGEANVEGVVMAIAPGQVVSGTVTLDGGDLKQVVPSATEVNLPLGATPANAQGSLSIVLSDTSPLPLNPAVQGLMKQDGTFAVENVARGKFQLSVAPLPAGTYLKSARFSNVDIVHSAIDLTSGGGAGIEVVLARNPADVSGTLMTDKNEPTASMLVTLWSQEPEPGVPNGGVMVGMTDETGGFRFLGLRPGAYYIAAWEAVDAGLVQYRDFLRLMAGEATKLSVAEGEHKATQVRIVPVERSTDAEGRLP
jgi:hypothetical protein